MTYPPPQSTTPTGVEPHEENGFDPVGVRCIGGVSVRSASLRHAVNSCSTSVRGRWLTRFGNAYGKGKSLDPSTFIIPRYRTSQRIGYTQYINTNNGLLITYSGKEVQMLFRQFISNHEKGCLQGTKPLLFL